MKNYSYVATGYKYGLMSYPNAIFKNNSLFNRTNDESNNQLCNDSEKLIKINGYEIERIVPFESVDGLQLDDLAHYSSLLHDEKYFVFIMYDEIPLSRQTIIDNDITTYSDPENSGFIHYIYLIDKDKNKESTIDEVIENHLISHLDKLNLSNRRRALSFLEKYVCKDRGSTNIDIENYLYDIETKANKEYTYYSKYIKIPYRLINNK